MFNDGIQRCVRYAFGPNRLHLCGPDANKEILSYITEQDPNKGLVLLLRQFKTMFPYLESIAHANGIADPFDERVVEAYWLGNELLENIEKKEFYQHLMQTDINKKMESADFDDLKNKLSGGAVMHHCFHVYNIWKQKKEFMNLKTHADVDNCRIGWGEVLKVDGPAITVKIKPLIYSEPAGFEFGPEYEKTIHRKLHDDFFENVKIGDMVSIHWNEPCEILTDRQVKNLEKYTRMSIELWNRQN